jgi:hypothetical protein
MVKIFQNDDRAILDMFEAEVLDRMGGRNSFIVNEHDLILRAKLTGSNNTVKLAILRDDLTPARAITLTKNDIFCMAHGLLGIQKMGKDSEGNVIALSEIVTFSDPSVFKGVDSKGQKEVDSVRAIYDSMLKLGTSRLSRIQDFHTRNFLHVPLKSNGVNNYGTSHSERGFYSFSRFSVLGGSKTNTLEVALPDNGRGAIAGNFDATGAIIDTWNELVFIAKGFIAIDAADAFDKAFSSKKG